LGPSASAGAAATGNRCYRQSLVLLALAATQCCQQAMAAIAMLAFLATVAAASPPAAAAAPLLQLDGDAPWIVPPELFRPSEAMSDEHADTAQTLALRDVELDWYKVTGYRAVIIANATWKPTLQLRPGQPAVFFGDAARHPWLEPTFNLTARGCGLERGAEAHCVLQLDGFMWGGEWVASPAVVAVGNGTRGAIYAAYAFSENALGVSPWYRFSFDQPAWTGRTLPLEPAAVRAFAPPQFRHRAIFLNDEELLGFFRRDPLGEQIFDMATLDMILETLLRAKANTIILGTTPYPDERSLKLAARRGVIITASHFEILGFNAFAWSRAYGSQSRQLWDWSKHPDLMAATWRAAIEAQKDYEMIWSLGLRGLNDYAYPGCEGPVDCGAVISEAVGNQTELLQEVLGKDVSELKFKFNLWVEALPLYEKGLLQLPPQTSLVMSDSGAGFIRGNADTFAHADGVYYHVQMLNGNGGQLSEFVPPSRIFEQLSSFARQARSTDIFVLNLSDLKPALLSAAAALAFVWEPLPYLVNGSLGAKVNQTADEAQSAFLVKWVAQQFTGADATTAAAIGELWRRYFELEWVAEGRSDEYLGGQMGGIATGLSADLLRNFSISDKTLTEATQGFALWSTGHSNATALHADATALLASVPEPRQQFFRSHILVQSAMQHFCEYRTDQMLVSKSSSSSRSSSSRSSSTAFPSPL
jgi:hypothetical protein